MKQILIIFGLLMMLSQSARAEEIVFYGIGIQILQKHNTSKDSSLIIVKIFDNSPAQKAGLKSEDRIIEIDGKNTKNLTEQDAAYFIRGAKGSEVKLLIKRDNKENLFAVKRDEIQVPKTVNAPDWTQFSPSRFNDSGYVEVKYLLPNPKSKYKKVILLPIIIPMAIIETPFVLVLRMSVQENNYWVNRRENFYKSLRVCETTATDLGNCYMQVSQSELQQNGNHEILNQQRVFQSINNYQWSIQNQQMQNMNNNLNNINNNLNYIKYRY